MDVTPEEAKEVVSKRMGRILNLKSSRTPKRGTALWNLVGFDHRGISDETFGVSEDLSGCLDSFLGAMRLHLRPIALAAVEEVGKDEDLPEKWFTSEVLDYVSFGCELLRRRLSKDLVVAKAEKNAPRAKKEFTKLLKGVPDWKSLDGTGFGDVFVRALCVAYGGGSVVGTSFGVDFSETMSLWALDYLSAPEEDEGHVLFARDVLGLCSDRGRIAARLFEQIVRPESAGGAPPSFPVGRPWILE